jgi:anthranilate synthase/aminodeoxychorismate synthase-like glutamine amidotransferase
MVGHAAVYQLAQELDPLSITGYGRHRPKVLLVIDNYDSFTFNLVQYFGQLGVSMKVFRNDELTPAEALKLNPDRVLISPGPCTPSDAGVSIDIIKTFTGKKPVLGVCLGHQAMGQHFGGKVIRAPRQMHGKLSPITHRNTDLFQGLPSPFTATRYHSPLVERSSFPDCLEITAETAEGEIMGLRHKQFPIFGVQFHPESIATEGGMKILQNFLSLN